MVCCHFWGRGGKEGREKDGSLGLGVLRGFVVRGDVGDEAACSYNAPIAKQRGVSVSESWKFSGWELGGGSDQTSDTGNTTFELSFASENDEE